MPSERGFIEKALQRKGFSATRGKKSLSDKAKCLTYALKTSLIAGNFPIRQEVAVNKSELVDAVASATGLQKSQAERAVDVVIDSVVSEVRAGRKVSIFGFGTFNPAARAARTGRNPQTGAP